VKTKKTPLPGGCSFYPGKGYFIKVQVFEVQKTGGFV